MKTVSYNGFQASVEFEDGTLFVRVLHIDDLLVAQCQSVTEVQGVLKELVDAYLEDCKELGREPTKPFSGSLNVRIGAEAHRRAAVAAAEEGVTLNAWIGSAITDKLECAHLAKRVDDVFKDARQDVELLRMTRVRVQSAAHVHLRLRQSARPSFEELIIHAADRGDVWTKLDG